MISLTSDVDDKDIVETDREHRWEMSSRTELERPHDVAVELVRRQRLERRDADALAPGAAVEPGGGAAHRPLAVDGVATRPQRRIADPQR